MKIGILALQGDFAAHGKMLESLGVPYSLVTEPTQLKDIDGLILPGGESTTMLKFLTEDDFLEKIQEFARKKGHVFGTCAGAILLANEGTDPAQTSLGLVDIAIERNAYGRQLGSHIGVGRLQIEQEQDFNMVFIRAPKITRIGESCRIFATYQGLPVGVLSDRVMLTTFHPELSQDSAVHRFFISQI
jgi:5'-phosphate synthase pdxT subunit